MSSSPPLQKENQKKISCFFFVHLSISIFLNINFYYNGGIACREENHDIKRWKRKEKKRYDDVLLWEGKSRQIWVEMVLHHNGSQTITLSFCLRLAHISFFFSLFFFIKPHRKHFPSILFNVYRLSSFLPYCLVDEEMALFHVAQEIKMLSFCCWSFVLQEELWVLCRTLLKKCAGNISCGWSGQWKLCWWNAFYIMLCVGFKNVKFSFFPHLSYSIICFKEFQKVQTMLYRKMQSK